MVLHGAADAIHREHVVVAHREVAAQVVGRHAGVDVVGRVDVEPSAEHVRRRVGGVDAGQQWLVEEPRSTGRLRGRSERDAKGEQGARKPRRMAYSGNAPVGVRDRR